MAKKYISERSHRGAKDAGSSMVRGDAVPDREHAFGYLDHIERP
jgi:hypothetical protein